VKVDFEFQGCKERMLVERLGLNVKERLALFALQVELGAIGSKRHCATARLWRENALATACN
jgi:hypothetical protein